jgi:hypothetical protein
MTENEARTILWFLSDVIDANAIAEAVEVVEECEQARLAELRSGLTELALQTGCNGYAAADWARAIVCRKTTERSKEDGANGT